MMTRCHEFLPDDCDVIPRASMGDIVRFRRECLNVGELLSASELDWFTHSVNLLAWKIICQPPPPPWCSELSSLFPHTCLNAASVLMLCYSIIPWSNVLLQCDIFIAFMRFRGTSALTYVTEDRCSPYLASVFWQQDISSAQKWITHLLLGLKRGTADFHWRISTLM